MDLQNNLKGELYNLRWNSYTTNLIEVFSEHQHRETLVDVTLTCEGQYFKAHKLILSACSGFFQEIFQIHGDVQHPIIVLNGIKFNLLKHLMNFIYQGEVKVLDADLEGLLNLAESLKIKGLDSVKLRTQASSQVESRTSHLNNVDATSTPPTPMSSQNPTLRQQKEVRVVNPCQNRNENRLEQADNLTKLVENIVRNKKTVDNLEQIHSKFNTLTERKEKRSEITTENIDKSIYAEESNTSTDSKNESGSRPTSAFMIFANGWRKKLAVEHPGENKKDISVRLSNMWKNLSSETKESYYFAAKQARSEAELNSSDKQSPRQVRKRKPRRKTIDSVAHLAAMEYGDENTDTNDDVIEIYDDTSDISANAEKKRKK